jgi:hypothetical protein
MRFRNFLSICLLFGLASVAVEAIAAPVAADFMKPPLTARPWVYAFWMEGNVTKQGITADLEAMAAQGIGGFLFMDGALGNPNGPYRFMSDSWREMFSYMMGEANRLGLQVNLNNGPGWAGSGGPWVTPAHATQTVIATETIIEGPKRFSATLEKPQGVNHDYYEDIAVLAYPAPERSNEQLYRIPDFASTKSFGGSRDFAGVVPWPRYIPTAPSYATVPAGELVASSKMQDLTARLDASGKLTWDVPRGRWLLMRFGHTVAKSELRSAQSEANGLETDKLSKNALDAQFAAMVRKLSDDIGPLTGKTLVSVHIDSWEAGSGNWTDGFREEFRRRRGYDLLPYMPTLRGIVVDSLEVSERFLWDFRETVSEMMLDNYAAHMAALAHLRGLSLSIEGFDGTADDLRYAGRADQPMSEFWQRPIYSGLPLSDLSEEMASAAHVYGKPIVGAEAFTARWGDFLDFPATLKPLADWAFSTGVNRLYFSEWVMQPWPQRRPGVSFQDLGTVFGAGLTWWSDSKAWHDYIARSQYLLQQGRFVADVCFITPEGAPGRFEAPIPATVRGGIPSRPPYNFDGCPAEVVLDGSSVSDGRVRLASGMEYRVLVLPTFDAQKKPVLRLMEGDDYFYQPAPIPKTQTMTLPLLRKVKELLEAGATVLGDRPLASPSLVGYPGCDIELAKLADEIWGRDTGTGDSGRRPVGKGQIIWGNETPATVLAGMKVPADFSTDDTLRGKLDYTHRRTDDGSEVYFVVNQQDSAVQGSVSFRVTGLQPEWWWPQSGKTERAAFFKSSDGVTQMPLSLNANESVFVVFRTSVEPHLVAVTSSSPDAVAAAGADDSFEVAAWVKPGLPIPMPSAAVDGWRYADPQPQQPAPGSQTYTTPGQGQGGFAVGANGVVVFQYGTSGEIEPLLAYSRPLGGPHANDNRSGSRDPIMLAAGAKRIHIGVVYKHHVPYLFIDGVLVKTGPSSRFPRNQSIGSADHRTFAADLAALDRFETFLRESGHQDLLLAPGAKDLLPALDVSHGLIWRSGTYTLTSSTGEQTQRAVNLPSPQMLQDDWQVRFDPSAGGPASVTFDHLQSWSTRAEPDIKFYSGAATYRKTFRVDLPRGGANRIFLDLGKVAVMADVVVNGKDLGVLWNGPYRVDITDTLKARGDNSLEVRVTNLWVNRLIGDEQLPEDSERDAEGTLKTWPQWIAGNGPSPTGRLAFTTRRIWKADDRLVDSGLLGPVRLLSAQTIETR